MEHAYRNSKFCHKEKRSHRKKLMWERIRTGKATESDLKNRARSQKSNEKWMKANSERLKEYRRKKYQRKKANAQAKSR